MAITIGTDSWVTLAEADTYFSERIGASAYWTATLTEVDKEAALKTSYRQINSLSYSFPTIISDSMKFAQCEQALMLAAFADEMFRRASLQAQGVQVAGVVKETYRLDDKVKISDLAKSLLSKYDVATAPMYTYTRTRNEEEE